MGTAKAFCLSTGFQCRRICHICSGKVGFAQNHPKPFDPSMSACPKQNGFSCFPSWLGYLKITLEEWHRFDDQAPWKLEEERPGACPFHRDGNPFSLILPGASNPWRIKPDLVHTFHIGFGVDLCASSVMWAVRKGKFPGVSIEDGIASAYAQFQSFCSTTHRFTSCELWGKLAFKMTKILELDINIFAWFSVSQNVLWEGQQN